ncbi:hypothetical protein B0O80DRAFT_533257 [Mortierella sp. GBAus27b]|nr:hypothetical protein BGX31_007169 [Mortierella sp. GBA43]KAI8347062.1 hypothetical protein B0O80DRAFT_533257 [Mortierella sp. GBAus27b]
MAPIQQNKVKVVLTGFEPFGSHLTNPSWLAIKDLNNTTLDLSSSPRHPKHGATQADLFCQQLPVLYREAPDLVSALHAKHSRKTHSGDAAEQHEDYAKTYFIHIGVGRDGHTAIETMAHRTGYSHPDNAQWSPESKEHPPVRKEEWTADPDELFTTVDTSALAEDLTTMGWICQQSQDAGHYLCEYTFYLSMAERNRRLTTEGQDERTCLFVHIPSVGNPYSLEELQRFVKDMVADVVSTY